MKRKWMETAVVWLLVIGPLLIGLGAAIWWGSGNNTVGLWGGFVPGTIALVFAAAFQLQTNIPSQNLPSSPKMIHDELMFFPKGPRLSMKPESPFR
jgi:hypothetical protein